MQGSIPRGSEHKRKILPKGLTCVGFGQTKEHQPRESRNYTLVSYNVSLSYSSISTVSKDLLNRSFVLLAFVLH